MPARLLLLASALGMGVYVLWQGVEKFCWEAFGTLIISPVIYVRICPQPFKYWLVSAVNDWPVVGFLLCLAPVAMTVLALGLAARACWKGSLPFAVTSCLLMLTIFAVYHSVKHMGIQLVYI